MNFQLQNQHSLVIIDLGARQSSACSYIWTRMELRIDDDNLHQHGLPRSLSARMKADKMSAGIKDIYSDPIAGP